MPVIAPATNYPDRPHRGSEDHIRVKHETVTVNDTTTPLSYPEHPDITVQAYAPSAWGGSTLTIQASLDGTNWATAHKADGSGDATLTANGIFTVMERGLKLRATLTGGTGTVDVLFLFNKQPRPR